MFVNEFVYKQLVKRYLDMLCRNVWYNLYKYKHVSNSKIYLQIDFNIYINYMYMYRYIADC